MYNFLPKLSQLQNDIHDVDHITVQNKLNDNARFTFSFLMLIIASTLICTMGLLIDSPSVVIGGMLISPLMWPLMKVSLGLSLGTKRSLKDAGGVLTVAILLSLLCSFLITFFSPLKVVNAEILARTQPTLLDIFVALAAGSIATLAVVQKRISDSLAGVAIAVSLLPPLCVGGIGLALWTPSVFSGGLVLFIANSISIIFASLVVFMAVGVRRKTQTQLQKEGIAFVVLALFITSIPLFIVLKDYSFQASAYQKTRTILEDSLSRLSPDSSIENITINTTKEKSRDSMLIEADILLPEGVTFNSQTKQSLVHLLQQQFQRPIDLRLRLQQTVSLLSKEDEAQNEVEKKLEEVIDDYLSHNPSLVLHSLQATVQKDNTWEAVVLLRGDPLDIPSERERQYLEDELSKAVTTPIRLNLEVIPGLTPLTESSVEDETIKKSIAKLLTTAFPQVEIADMSLSSQPIPEQENAKTKKRTTITVELRVPQQFKASKQDLDAMTDKLEKEYQREFLLILRTVEVTVITN